MTKKFNLYLGKAGQFSIMSEFLARGWNTCTPDVDVGDDVLVLEDKKGEFKRIQVKTATAFVKKDGYSVQFHIPLKQLSQYITPDLYYVFMVRHQKKWVNTMIIERTDLYDMFTSLQIGVANSGSLTLYLSFKDSKMMCKKVDFTSFIDDFSAFPDILH